MPLPVSAKNDLDGYILETTIVVKIPKGTEGELVQEIRNDLVIVQFDIPSLPVLRVSKKDLLMTDSIDAVVSEMQRILNIKPFIERDVHRAADNLLLRALETLSTDENNAEVKTLIHLYQKINKHYQ